MFTILAVDHRDALRLMLRPDHMTAVSAKALTDIKLDIVRQSGAAASAILLDP